MNNVPTGLHYKRCVFCDCSAPRATVRLLRQQAQNLVRETLAGYRGFPGRFSCFEGMVHALIRAEIEDTSVGGVLVDFKMDPQAHAAICTNLEAILGLHYDY